VTGTLEVLSRAGGASAFSGVLGNQWVAFLLRRLLAFFVIMIGIAFASFMIVRLIPGDPAIVILGDNATGPAIDQVHHELGLDQPFLVQMLSYFTNLAHGDLGNSFVTQEPVAQILVERIPNSLQLASLSLLLVLLAGVPLGIIAGALTRHGRHRGGELGFTTTTSVVGSLPEYLTGTFLAFLFAVWLRILPVAGSEGFASLILPTLAISLRPIAILARIVRVETLNVLAQDYVTAARSKRLPIRILYLRHVLPNVITAALTIGGILFASLIGGAVVVENVFARAGLGTALVTAVLDHDYPLIQGIALALGFTVVAVNTIVDILLTLIDPRSLAKQA
jgi:peptide/nickel transport system permease protein